MMARHFLRSWIRSRPAGFTKVKGLDQWAKRVVLKVSKDLRCFFKKATKV